ncbi:hypothetical protein ACFQLX_00905 [Streptomyces polyrhachis]|uniref:DUF308 domain-containing protein n=1 Tax=Streptomyces polyrhachis TaxID=1282885 RepID=A0ABW2GAH6_9ACTN
MTERNPAGEPEEVPEGPPAETAKAADDPGAPSAAAPLDEEAAWAQIVAAYGEEPQAAPVEPPAGSPDTVRSITVFPAGGSVDAPAETAGDASADPFADSFTNKGPRDWDLAKPSEGDLDSSDEGHFVPPEPPPLPQADTTTRFAWLGVLGGPLLLIVLVVAQEPITWWSALVGLGGFFGGFATLVMRMRPGDEDDDELPGGGAVV